MKYYLFLAVILIFAGCSSTKIAVNEDFWKEQNSRIGIIFCSKPEPGAYKEGSQGLLDIVINNAMASNMAKHLETVDVSEFNEVKNIFKERLEERGLNNVQFIDSEVNLDSLPKFINNTDKKTADRDFTTFKRKYNIDHLIVLTISRYGTLRSYYGFIPLGSPKALFQAKGMMIDLSNNAYEWYIEMKEDESVKDVIGEWDEEPDFPNLTKALIEAMHSSEDFLNKNFFEFKG